jgi:hypothetical protein
MSNRTRSIIKVVAVVLVLLAVMMHIGFIAIAGLGVYKFWMVVIAFGLLLISTK